MLGCKWDPGRATETPDEIMRRAHQPIDTTLARDLLDHVRFAPPEFFERLRPHSGPLW
jgi:hypothetical protein